MGTCLNIVSSSLQDLGNKKSIFPLTYSWPIIFQRVQTCCCQYITHWSIWTGNTFARRTRKDSKKRRTTRTRMGILKQPMTKLKLHPQQFRDHNQIAGKEKANMPTARPCTFTNRREWLLIHNLTYPQVSSHSAGIDGYRERERKVNGSHHPLLPHLARFSPFNLPRAVWRRLGTSQMHNYVASDTKRPSWIKQTCFSKTSALSINQQLNQQHILSIFYMHFFSSAFTSFMSWKINLQNL